MTDSVSVVIPTIGRETLGRAVHSALAQTRAVTEVIVVADGSEISPTLPDDDRIHFIRTDGGQGAAYCRQVGLDAARGSVIALLDDDDQWHPEKLARQLAVAENAGGPYWVASSRVRAVDADGRHRIWPRRLIGPRDRLAEYLFRVTEPRTGGAVLQTSTLCFPAEVARRVRWDTHADEVHDEPSWLLDVESAIPDLRWVQVPEPLTDYHVDTPSVSRSRDDDTDRYVQWGLTRLRDESSRVRGDYLCTSPVSAAVSARSMRGARRAVAAGLRHGRPGIAALLYAAGNIGRIAVLRIAGAVRR